MSIAIEIKNPIAPTNPNPIAETFEIVVNSFLEGFFKSCQTLPHCFINDFKLNILKKSRLKPF